MKPLRCFLILLFFATAALSAPGQRSVLNNVTIVLPGPEPNASPDQVLPTVQVRCWARIPYPPTRRDLLELSKLPVGNLSPIRYAPSDCFRQARATIQEKQDHTCTVVHVPAKAMQIGPSGTRPDPATGCFRVSQPTSPAIAPAVPPAAQPPSEK